MSDSPLRLVLDTNVCLDLLLFKDPKVADLAQQLQRGELIAYRDEATVEEWRRVVAYAVWKLSGERQRTMGRSARAAIGRRSSATCANTLPGRPEASRPASTVCQ